MGWGFRRRIILNWDEGQNTEADTIVVQAISFTPLPLGPLHNRHSRLSSVGSSARSCFFLFHLYFLYFLLLLLKSVGCNLPI